MACPSRLHPPALSRKWVFLLIPVCFGLYLIPLNLSLLPTRLDDYFSAVCDEDTGDSADSHNRQLIDGSRVTHRSPMLFIHQSWKTSKLPQRFRKWSDSWKRCFPHAKHILWTDKDNRYLIAKHYPWFLRRYDALDMNIIRADAARYIYLFHFGGIYADLDTECVRPFSDLIDNASIVFGAMEAKSGFPDGLIQNSFMFSRPRHPFWLDFLHVIMSLGNHLSPEDITGHNVIGRLIKGYQKRFRGTKEIVIFPPKYFNPFSWDTNTNSNCKTYNKMTDAELAACRETFLNSSYVIQYHAHTWGGGKIV